MAKVCRLLVFEKHERCLINNGRYRLQDQTGQIVLILSGSGYSLQVAFSGSGPGIESNLRVEW